MAIEICAIISEKGATPVSRQPRPIPLNTARNGRDLEWQCLIFERCIASSPCVPDQVSFLGTRVLPALAHPFASRFGATQFTRCPALVGAYYTNVYLGYETIFESPGVVPGTLSSRGGWGGRINPLTTCATGKHWFRSLTDLFY